MENPASVPVKETVIEADVKLKSGRKTTIVAESLKELEEKLADVKWVNYKVKFL